MKKILLFLTLCTMLGISSKAQSNATWVEIETNDGVKISMRYADCEMNSGFDEKRVLLKFENTSSVPVSVTWDSEMYYDGNCHYCGNYTESSRTIELDANGTQEGACVRGKDFELYYVVKFLNTEGKTLTPIKEMTDFELLNITVSKL